MFGDPHDKPIKDQVARLHTHGAVAPRVREPSIEDVEHVKQLHGREAWPMLYIDGDNKVPVVLSYALDKPLFSDPDNRPPPDRS